MGEQQKSNQTEQDLNHVQKARRDKLAELQAAGKDPFQITKYDVTAHSMDISLQVLNVAERSLTHNTLKH